MTTVIIPMRVQSVPNMREHWAARYRRWKAEKAMVTLALRQGDMATTCARLRSQGPDASAVVTLTRLAPRRLDDDNCIGGMKAVRDGVAFMLGVDDGEARVEYRYAQERSAKYFLKIEIEETT